ncbi:hypothetical protein EDD17DRAFT_1477944 [Pisolithus thermaeus]|nr:hypothetical protein EV401DRAFT_2065488 [Pisolithus croceorrhizus]KAI6162563.1 hypothetical protein EDD17DRAFT_1477944 [Pisolithus thermaeus]
MPITEFASLQFKAARSLAEPDILALFQKLSAWQSECSGYPLLFFTNPKAPSEIHLITGWEDVETHETWILGERNQELLRVFTPFINILGMVHLDIDFERIPKDAESMTCLKFGEGVGVQVAKAIAGNFRWAEIGQNLQDGCHEEYIFAQLGYTAELNIEPTMYMELQRVHL